MQRFDYSVIGDDVNIASRLEGQTKTYGVPIIAGPETVALAPELAFIELDRVRVKGRSRPLAVHALVGDAQRAAAADFRALREAQSAMLAHYRAGALAAAVVALDEVAALDGHGLLAENCRLYRERIAALGDAPLPPDWDGTHDLLTK
jgi:adenylate cyclase